MNPSQHYRAFISHRSSDKAFVFWLQKKLEHYSVGRKQREKYGLRAKTVSPLCVDTYEFTSNELKKEIAQKLDQSEKMILICSFASASPVPGRLDWSADPAQVRDWSADPAASGWVGYEIDYMLKAGRMKDIIPVVIEGDPENGDCFHPLVKELVKNDLLYYDFRKFKKTERISFLKLVGATLGIENLSEIYDHDKKRKRVHAGLFAGLGLGVLAAALWAWSYYLPHEKNYSDYTMVNGLPEGIHELSRSETEALASHYVITTTKAQHLLELRHVNSAGTPVEDETEARIDRPMIAVYRCRANWSPDTVEYRDRNGIVQMTYAYATDMRYMTFQENEYTSDQVYPSTEVDEYGVPIRMKIDRYDLSYEEGRLVRRMYMSGVNYCIDESGVAGEQYSYDDAGRVTALRYLNRAMEVSANQNGVAGMDYRYDEAGRLLSATIVNAEGEPVYGTDWYSIVRYSYSELGQILQAVYYTPEGEETICSGGYSRMLREYDARGNRVREYYTGPSGEALFCADKYHSASYGYNERGDMLSAAYFDENGAAVLHKEGYAALGWERDPNGNPTRTVYYGTDGTPMPSDNYAAIICRSYNEAGYVIEETNYDLNENEIISRDGFFRRRVSCDEKGRPTDIAVFGLNEDPVYCAEGWHRMHLDYDDRGNLGKITLYGTSEQLLPFGGYWASQERAYNGGGQVISVKYTDQFGKPVVAGGLYATVENTYDDRGLLTSSTYYDSEGKLTVGSVSIQNGVQVGRRSYAKVEYEYDEAGNETRRTYYGEDGELTSDIAPIEEFEYDEVGRVTSYSYREKDGALSTVYQAVSVLEYDEFGRTLSISYFDAEGNPTRSPNGSAFHLSRKDYRGNQIESMDTDPEGNLIGYRILYGYDPRGLQTDARYVDRDGNPVMNDQNYSMLTIEYDNAGNRTRVTSCDTEGNPVDRKGGACSQEMGYDAGGAQTEIRYYGADGEPMDLPAGYHGYRMEFNDYRRMTRIEFFDKDDTVLFRYEAAYKDYIYPTEEALYGRNGEPIESRGYKIWKVVSEYDENNQKKATYYYGKDGKLRLLLDLFAGWSSEYENGLEIGRTYYGTDGKPYMIDKGFASVRMERNEIGQEIRRVYLDPEGKPVNNVYGFSVMEVGYEENGEISSSAFYDTEGRRVEPDGDAVLEDMFLYDDANAEQVYNPDTGKIETMYFSVGSYRVRLLAFKASDGSRDQFAQPKYFLFNQEEINDYIYMSARSYVPQIGEDDAEIDVSGYQEAEGWKAVIDSYVAALESGDSGQITSLMDLSSVKAAVQQLNEAVNEPKTEAELIGFYTDFWQNALDEMQAEFSERYGEVFRIYYEILDVQEYDEGVLAAVNQRLQELYPGTVSYTGIVNLTLRYTVSGTNGSGMEKEGYLTPSLALMQTEEGWTLGTGNGFPGPSTEELLQFLGGLKD